MNADYTDITIILDRSGSMEIRKADTEGGLANFIEQQKQVPGKVTLSLIQFDEQYEVVYSGQPINDVGPHKFEPRGSTALLDAVGKTIVNTGERFSALPEADRPGLVVFVIITDGQENASREYNKAQVQKMVQEQTDVYKWQFTFMGADQDAWLNAQSVGMQNAAAVISSQGSQGFQGALGAVGNNVKRMRAAYTSGGIVLNAYTDEERLEAAGGGDPVMKVAQP